MISIEDTPSVIPEMNQKCTFAIDQNGITNQYDLCHGKIPRSARVIRLLKSKADVA